MAMSDETTAMLRENALNSVAIQALIARTTLPATMEPPGVVTTGRSVSDERVLMGVFS